MNDYRRIVLGFAIVIVVVASAIKKMDGGKITAQSSTPTATIYPLPSGTVPAIDTPKYSRAVATLYTGGATATYQIYFSGTPTMIP